MGVEIRARVSHVAAHVGNKAIEVEPDRAARLQFLQHRIHMLPGADIQPRVVALDYWVEAVIGEIIPMVLS
jgi:hypothetical protein